MFCLLCTNSLHEVFLWIFGIWHHWGCDRLQWGQEKDFTRLYSRSFQTPLNNLKQSFGKIGQKGENNDPTVEFKENCFDFHIGLETWFKVTAHPFPTSTIYVKYKPKVEIIHNYTWSWKVTLKTEVWLDLDLETWFKVTVHPSPTRHSVGEIWARSLGQVEKYVQDMWYWTDRLIRHQQSRAFKKYL